MLKFYYYLQQPWNIGIEIIHLVLFENFDYTYLELKYSAKNINIHSVTYCAIFVYFLTSFGLLQIPNFKSNNE